MKIATPPWGTRSGWRDPGRASAAVTGRGWHDATAYGAEGDGVTDDTEALQAALSAIDSAGGTLWLPPGTFRFSAPLVVKSGTTIMGLGTLKAAPIAEWPGSPYFCLTNEHNTALDLTDHDITVDGITIDYADLPSADGTRHGIYFQCVTRVRVLEVTVKGGSSSCALVGCDDTEEIGCTYIGFSNCGSDKWAGTSARGPSRARVIDCHIECDASAQMANFNPDGTLVTEVGYVADGLVFVGNTLVSHEASATPLQFEPLRINGATRNLIVAANIFVNAYLVLRGDTRGVLVEGNEMSGFAGTSEAITGYTRAGGTPADVLVAQNIVLDPLTSVGSVAVIRMESDTATIAFNRIAGSAYGAAPVSVGSTLGQMFSNQSDGTPIAGILQTGFRLRNGSGNYIGFTDASGGVPRFYVQADNNMVWHGTNASGGQRTILSCYMRSNTSELIASVPLLFGDNTRWTPDAAVAAAGTTIGTATALAATFNKVTSCTAGAADGVVLSPTVGRMQWVTNATAATLKVYPNNSGSSQIDGGGVGTPVTILSGKTKGFLYYETADFRTIGQF